VGPDPVRGRMESRISLLDCSTGKSAVKNEGLAEACCPLTSVGAYDRPPNAPPKSKLENVSTFSGANGRVSEPPVKPEG